MNKIAIAAGGTGGHITPALRVAEKWIEAGGQCIWFGRKDSLEETISSRAGIPFYSINASLNRRSKWKQAPMKSYRFFSDVRKVKQVLRYLNVRAVFSTGGYVSLAPALAVKMNGGKLMIHEQNAYMGAANKLLSKLSNEVVLGMPISGWQEKHIVGNPSGFVNKKTVRSDKKNVTLLVIGGSQGCHFFNKKIPNLLSKIGSDLKVIHIAGSEASWVREKYMQLNIDAKVHVFCDKMAEIYHQADFVVARSGALTLSELSLNGLPSILVPYPHAAANHQLLNAQYYERSGAAKVISEDEDELLNALKLMMSDSFRSQMSQNVELLAKPHAAVQIVQKLQAMLNATQTKVSS